MCTLITVCDVFLITKMYSAKKCTQFAMQRRGDPTWDEQSAEKIQCKE